MPDPNGGPAAGLIIKAVTAWVKIKSFFQRKKQ